MNWKSLLFAVALLVLVAGCAAPKAPAPAAPAPAPAPSAPSEGDAMMEKVSVEWISVPDSVAIGKPIELSWRVSGEGDITTAVYHSTKSQADAATPSYQSVSPKVALTGAGEHSTSIIYGDPITVYVRAGATVDGTMYWSDERAVTISVTTKTSSADETA